MGSGLPFAVGCCTPQIFPKLVAPSTPVDEVLKEDHDLPNTYVEPHLKGNNAKDQDLYGMGTVIFSTTKEYKVNACSLLFAHR